MTTKKAKEYGKKAYKNGNHRAPALDTEFTKQLNPGVGANSELLKAWLKGYDTEVINDIMAV